MHTLLDDGSQHTLLLAGITHVRLDPASLGTVLMFPTCDVLFGIGPQQIAQQPRVRDVRGADDALDLLHRRDFGGQTAVHTQDLLVHHRCHGKAVERITERLPQLDIVSALALVVETWGRAGRKG